MSTNYRRHSSIESKWRIFHATLSSCKIYDTRNNNKNSSTNNSNNNNSRHNRLNGNKRTIQVCAFFSWLFINFSPIFVGVVVVIATRPNKRASKSHSVWFGWGRLNWTVWLVGCWAGNILRLNALFRLGMKSAHESYSLLFFYFLFFVYFAGFYLFI